MEKNNILKDILLKMKYNPLNTLTENKILVEQPIGYDYALERQAQKQLSQAAEANKLKLRPGEVDVSNEFLMVPGHWALSTPYGYIWVPEGTEYKLFDGNLETDTKWYDFTKTDAEFKRTGFPCVGKITPQVVQSKLLVKGTCRIFFLPTGEKYIFMWKVSETCQLSATGYMNTADGSYYKSPKVIDTRTEWQKFLDEHAIAFQIAGSLVLALVGTILTAGLGAPASLAIALEILGEMAINIPVGIRELEKGENVGASLSFIFAVLPIVKTAAGLGKISSTMAAELSQDLANANIKTSEELATFVKSLPADKQLAMNIVLKQDPKNLQKVISTNLNEELSKWLQTNRKSLLGKLPVTSRAWAKSLGVDAMIFAPAMAYKVFFGTELPPEEARKLNGFVLSYPPESQKRVIEIMVTNPDVIKTVIKDEETAKKIIDTYFKPKDPNTGLDYTPQQIDSISNVAREKALQNLENDDETSNDNVEK